MKPIEFAEQNCVFAKNQPQYLPLPACIRGDDHETIVISCWRLTLWERVKVLFGGHLWLSQLTFGHPLQPQLPQVESPFEGVA